MSFQDDSHILSRLGILDSTLESPKKTQSPRKPTGSTQERERFVDVNIDGEVTSESDDDPIFDQSLISSQNRPRIGRRKSESYACRYILILLSFFSLGIAFHSAPNILPSNVSSHRIYLIHSCAMFAGACIGRSAVARINSSLLLFIGTTVIYSLSLILYSTQEINTYVIGGIQGVFIGLTLYVGLSVWFAVWRCHNRKLMLMYAVLAAGASLSIILHTNTTTVSKFVQLSSVEQPSLRLKRDDNVTVTSDLANGDSEDPKPKKPLTAQGTASVETKTKKNEEMRLKVADMKSNETSNAEISFNSTEASPLDAAGSTHASIAYSTELPTTVSTTVPTTTTYVTSTTKEYVRTTTSGFGREKYGNDERDFLTRASELDLRVIAPVELYSVIILSITVVFYALGFTCCCLSWRCGVDAKMLKLADPSVSGLTRGCRLRFSAVHMMIGFTESVLMMMMTVSLDGKMTVACTSAMFSRFVAVIMGGSSYSLLFLWFTLLSTVVAAIGLLFSPDSTVILVVLSSGIALLGPTVLLYVETKLSPRPAVLIDYSVFPSLFGHIVAVAFCEFISSSVMHGSLLLVLSLVIGTMFILVRSVSKAARLKEIMEYSSHPVPDALGEYLSLVDRDQDSSSELDDDLDSENLLSAV